MLAALLFAAAVNAPAASLLLPRFEVSLQDRAFNTVVQIRNTRDVPEIIRVRLHTDRGYAVLWFTAALPPHGSTKVDFYRLLAEGRYDSPCDDKNPYRGSIGPVAAEVRGQLTSGCIVPAITTCRAVVGRRHAHAIGYAVVDVVASCSLSDAAPRLDDPALTGTFEQLAAGRPIAAGPLAPMPLPPSVTVQVPRGAHDVIVWRGPREKVACGKAGADDFEIVRAEGKKTLTFTGDQVAVIVSAPMPPDPKAKEPPPGCAPGAVMQRR